MNTYPDRVQFRLSKTQSAIVRELANSANTTPNQIAKRLFEAALEKQDVDPEKLAEDLLVIRAGMEQLFRRADRVDELSNAIARVRERRSLTDDTPVLEDHS